MGDLIALKSKLFVCNIPSDIDPADLSVLISKLCPVIEVFIPSKTATGLHRNFAIVIIQGDAEISKKCVKTFNACHWKGSKIHVEIAKQEYYKDRLAREKAVEEEAQMTVDQIDSSDIVSGHVEEQSTDLVDPILENVYKGGLLKIRAKKLQPPILISTVPRFNPDLAKGAKAPCSRKILFDDDFNPIIIEDPIIPEPEELQSLEEKVKDEKDHAIVEASVEEVKIAMPVIGKGVRKGFGTLMKGVTGPIGKPTFRSGTEDRDCCVENISKPKYQLEESEDDDDDGTGIRYNDNEIEDNRDHNFVAEKEKALAILQLLGNIGTTTGRIKGTTATTNRRSGLMGSLMMVPRYDPTKATAALFEASSPCSSGNSSRCSSPGVENDQDGNVDESTKNVVVIQPTAESENRFADLSELKEIFYKEGGVWWGDDGTMNEKVGKGTIAQDRLFLEAEKLGYDIRGTDDANKKSMSFGFFDGDDDPFSAVSHFTPTSATSNRMEDTLVHRKSEQSVRGEVGTIDGVVKPHWQPTGSIQSTKTPEPTYQRPNIAQLVESAQRFKRDRSEAELIADWKSNREKLTMDYKRKKRDAKKRLGASSASSGGPQRTKMGGKQL